MYIVHKKKFLLFHLRKTGGISLGKMIRNQYSNAEAVHKHIPYRWLPEKYQEYVRNYYVITWVRNPFHRIVSWWEYINWKSKPENNKKANRKKMQDFLRRVPDFNTFIYSLQTDKSRDSMEHWYFQRTMTFALSDENGNILADYIGKQENFIDDWNTLAPRIGCESQKVMYRNSFLKERDLRKYFKKPELVDIVYNFFQSDFNNFNYEIPKEL